MNSLSWLLYVAGMVSSLGTALMVFAIVGGIGGILSFIGYIVMLDEDEEEWTVLWVKIMKYCLPITIISILLIIIVPSSSTLYMIAASELGEEIVTMPEVQNTATQALELIRQRISIELQELTVPTQ